MVPRRRFHALVMSDCYRLRALLLTFAGWANRERERTIEYLVEENRVLKERLGGRRLRLTDDQRRGVAAGRWCTIQIDPPRPPPLTVSANDGHRAGPAQG